MTKTDALLAHVMDGGRIGENEYVNLFSSLDPKELTASACILRDRAHGNVISYSRKVFIPLTRLCRDVCHYCTFAHSPKQGQTAYLTPEQAVEIARRGAAAGCKEALFTLGDKPELRWEVARRELATLGFDSTLSYLAHVADLVRRETGLLPHLNPGVMTEVDLAALRPYSISMGLMLEGSANVLSEPGGAHYGSPDKELSARVASIEAAGRMSIPFTSGILIGIGESRRDRIESLLALRDLNDRYGHLQEVIIQNFVPKPGTRMANTPAAERDDHVWTCAIARILLGPAANIQAPPNLSLGYREALLAAGINDWGGVSPVTVDHVNPEAPWPGIDELASTTARAGKSLVERLAIYPSFARDAQRWVDPSLQPLLLRKRDASGFAREDDWISGVSAEVPPSPAPKRRRASALSSILERAADGERLKENESISLFDARGTEFVAVCEAADDLRKRTVGDVVRYVVNRNINYTNICNYGCKFCAFSKGRTHEHLRGKPYNLDMSEIGRRVAEAWDRGATEVCLQGGIHPSYTGETYLEILEVAKAAAPSMHIHAFSPLEVWHGAKTLSLSLPIYLEKLRRSGLGSLPGTAAEILDDEIRDVLCPDKLTTAEWFQVIDAAHSVGLRTTATIMFGHIDGPENWFRHLTRLRDQQERTRGFTEFVPLPFVAEEAPIFLKNAARQGPTYREAVLMHAVARLMLHPLIPHIQTSWVKMGPEGARACLRAGADDLGGTLMNESITRAAGAVHGQEFAPERMQTLIESIGRRPAQRTTLYKSAAQERVRASFGARELAEIVSTPLQRKSSTGLLDAGPFTEFRSAT